MEIPAKSRDTIPEIQEIQNPIQGNPGGKSRDTIRVTDKPE
jgi:hypothetical protein